MSKSIPKRGEYAVFIPVTSRWMDNDQYGHINNVVYYSYFDTAVNQWIADNALLGPSLFGQAQQANQNAPIGLVVQTHCEFHSGLSFPQALCIGLRLGHMGNTSVRYELAVFAQTSDLAAAHGHFVHVYVNATTRRPVELPDGLKGGLQKLVVSA
jgi:acyl-CoA thioester hydrolase